MLDSSIAAALADTASTAAAIIRHTPDAFAIDAA
jgi:hypothetical protein